ncbi:MAG: ROK family protein [Clostridiales bacterium]|nr:ROK family protein [Clostridiales bacterium]
MGNIICFDIGGTYIKYAAVTNTGDILFKDKIASPCEDCRINIPKVLSSKILKLKDKYDLSSVGISTAGQVDSENGIVVSACDNLPDYSGARLSMDIGNMTGLKVYVENDANAAALGEMWKGAAKGVQTFVCITIGTGIGGAIIIDGKLYKGIKGGAGEIGHMIINENGEPCTCGSRGCFERYASTQAFVRRYICQSQKNGHTVDHIDGEEIMKRVREGQKLAISVYDEFLNHLVSGLVSLTYLLDPGLIVIGGGISAQGRPFFDEIERRFKQRVMPSYFEHTRIVQAVLENDAGIYGACYVALHR